MNTVPHALKYGQRWSQFRHFRNAGYICIVTVLILMLWSPLSIKIQIIGSTSPEEFTHRSSLFHFFVSFMDIPYLASEFGSYLFLFYFVCINIYCLTVLTLPSSESNFIGSILLRIWQQVVIHLKLSSISSDHGSNIESERGLQNMRRMGEGITVTT